MRKGVELERKYLILPATVQAIVTASFIRAEVLSGVVDSTVLALTEIQVVRYVIGKYHDDYKFNEPGLMLIKAVT